MSKNIFKFDNIAGQAASLEVSELDEYIEISWGGITIADTFGNVGFWSAFHKTPESLKKGAARDAALRKFAKERIEDEIFQFVANA